MKVLIVVVVVALLAVGAYAKVIVSPYEPIITGDEYHEKIGIPEAERIRLAEEQMLSDPSRIVGGSAAHLGQFPYTAGLQMNTNNGATSVCGGTLLNNQRVLTAAHCCIGIMNSIVVLGSITLFTGGGIRINVPSNNHRPHAGYNGTTNVNDIAMLFLPISVTYSNIINPIAYATGNTNFANFDAVASGFGRTSDNAGISNNQYLSHVTVSVITNAVCQQTYGTARVVAATLCTSGATGSGACGGDSGGPLVTWTNNVQALIGVMSFSSAAGCQVGHPTGYTRVTSHTAWINDRV